MRGGGPTGPKAASKSPLPMPRQRRWCSQTRGKKTGRRLRLSGVQLGGLTPADSRAASVLQRAAVGDTVVHDVSCDVVHI
eukprot:7899714-Lingulodinium_polyedra.AAC.1